MTGRYEGCSDEVMFNVKKVLKNFRFRLDKNVEAMVMEQVQQQPSELFPGGIQQLVHQWDACLSALRGNNQRVGFSCITPHRYDVIY
jgi:hypothetical protein